MFGLTDAQEPNEIAEDEAVETPSGGSSRIILWLIVLGLGMLLMPLYLVGNTIKEDNLRLEEELVALKTTLESPVQMKPEARAFSEDLTALQSQINALTPLESNLTSTHMNWPVIMATISQYDLGRMRINTLVESDHAIMITGCAENQEVVMAYSNRLRDSNQFDRVTIQSIESKVLPTPTPVPEGATADAGNPYWPKCAAFTIALALKPEQTD